MRTTRNVPDRPTAAEWRARSNEAVARLRQQCDRQVEEATKACELAHERDYLDATELFDEKLQDYKDREESQRSLYLGVIEEQRKEQDRLTRLVPAAVDQRLQQAAMNALALQLWSDQRYRGQPPLRRIVERDLVQRARKCRADVIAAKAELDPNEGNEASERGRNVNTRLTLLDNLCRNLESGLLGQVGMRPLPPDPDSPGPESPGVLE